MREGMRGGCWLTSGESEWDRECGAAKGGGDEGKGGLCKEGGRRERGRWKRAKREKGAGRGEVKLGRRGGGEVKAGGRAEGGAGARR